MPADKKQPRDLFPRLYQALQEDTPDVSAMRSLLEEQGVDVAATVSGGLRLFSEFKKRKRLQRARMKLDRLRAAVGVWAGTTEYSFTAMRDDIARALTGDGGDVVYQTYHRKLKRVDSDDLESLHEDAALLEFIERIESEETE